MRIFINIFAMLIMIAGIIADNNYVLIAGHIWVVGSILYGKIEDIGK